VNFSKLLWNYAKLLSFKTEDFNSEDFPAFGEADKDAVS